MLYFLWRDSNDEPSASCSLGHLSSRAVGQQFYVGPDRFCISQCLLVDLLLQYSVDKRTCSRLDTEECLERLKGLDGNVCACPCYIVTIDPPKDTENTSQMTKRSGPT